MTVITSVYIPEFDEWKDRPILPKEPITISFSIAFEVSESSDFELFERVINHQADRMIALGERTRVHYCDEFYDRFFPDKPGKEEE